MATSKFKALFLRHCDRKGIKYTEIDDFTVRVSYTGDHLKSIPIIVSFDKDNDPLVALRCWEICNFKGSKFATGILTCNCLNEHYRWCKFSIDNDRDMVMRMDTYVTPDSCGDIVLSLVRRSVNIIDEAYPNIFKASEGANPIELFK